MIDHCPVERLDRRRWSVSVLRFMGVCLRGQRDGTPTGWAAWTEAMAWGERSRSQCQSDWQAAAKMAPGPAPLPRFHGATGRRERTGFLHSHSHGCDRNRHSVAGRGIGIPDFMKS